MRAACRGMRRFLMATRGSPRPPVQPRQLGVVEAEIHIAELAGDDHIAVVVLHVVQFVFREPA
jgi:hypothetical protein